MKRAVSISIGSSKRDKAVEIELLGEKVLIERLGTDGDMEKAARLYQELDGKVDAFGVGGADLGLMVGQRWYPFYSVRPMVRFVRETPLVDGNGLKNTLERRVATFLEMQLESPLPRKTVLVVSAADRWGMATSFAGAGYDCRFGDLIFSLGLPFTLRSLKSLKNFAALLMPVAGRIPFQWLYPTGKEQEKHTPKGQEHFIWAQVIAGDCHYITRYMPDRLEGKVIVTNTTTPDDRELFCRAGVKSLVTTTPVLDGRSFGTNMMEAAIIAATGRTQPVDYAHIGAYLDEMDGWIDRLQLTPQLQELN
ncbi:MAG: quinate 5-dehydrogenase [Chloroflexi bacterium]|nr:quinate 5-dehydrogenase [Chloroflexota bacterium]